MSFKPYDPCGHREEEIIKVQHRIAVAREQEELSERNTCGGYYCSEEHGHIDCHDPNVCAGWNEAFRNENPNA
jgi:hypothetical protein